MTMGVIVYYAEISGSKEVKKRQQRVMMILESKTIPYEAIDITEAGKENDKEFMMKNGKIRGDTKYVQSPQIFNGEVYCGDYEDFDLANENDVLEAFLNTPKIDRSSPQKNGKIENGSGGASREGSSEPKPEIVPEVKSVPEVEPEPSIDVSASSPVSVTPPPSDTDVVVPDSKISTTTEDEDKVNEDGLGDGNNEAKAVKDENEDAEEEEEEEEKSQVDK